VADRCFSAAELAALARTPRQELEASLEAGPTAAAEAASSIARSYRDQVGGSRAWVAAVFAYVAERHGQDGLAAAAAATSRLFHALAACGALPQLGPDGAGHVRTAEQVADDADAVVASVRTRAAGGDRAGAMAAFDQFEDACRTVQDGYRDWLSALLSEVYRRWGPDELESVHRYCAERTLLPWMAVDVRNAPEKRLVRWVRMLKGHFSGVRVREDDEKFVLVQDPCGTCARQVRDGRYGPPVGLAVVEEEHAVTWGRGTTPVYRTHVPVWHIMMARERLGAPWPVNRCPAGMGTGPCETLLYKDPTDQRANAFVPGPDGAQDTSAAP
jgi:hypothetical protein